MNNFQYIPPECVNEYRIVFMLENSQRQDTILNRIQEFITEYNTTKNFTRPVGYRDRLLANNLITFIGLASADIVEKIRTKIKQAHLTDLFLNVEITASVFKIKFDTAAQQDAFEKLTDSDLPKTINPKNGQPILYFTEHNISDFHLKFNKMQTDNPEKWQKCGIFVQENYLSWTAAELREEHLNEIGQEERPPKISQARKL